MNAVTELECNAETACTADDIIELLSIPGPLPTEVIQEARTQKDTLTPRLIQALYDYADRPDIGEDEGMSYFIFLAFHLLGEWRSKEAFPAMLRLVEKLPKDDLEMLFGDYFAEAAWRAMANCYNGDVEGLESLLLNQEIYEFDRWNLWHTYILLVLKNAIEREHAIQFIRSCHSRMEQKESVAWEGWRDAIEMLALEEMIPLVKNAFDQGFIDPGVSGDLEECIKDIAYVREHGETRYASIGERYEYFTDVITEFKNAYYFTPKYWKEETERERQAPLPEPAYGTHVNPFRYIGRNDPCPCGSGRKYKKCCLGAAGAIMQGAPD